jgi:hypothetical protein
MTVLEPDRDQIEIFVDAIFRHASPQGFVTVRSFLEEQDRVFRITPAAITTDRKFMIDVCEDDARRAAQNPKPVVFCPPLATFLNKDHAREQDLLEGLALSVECDQYPQQARAKLESLLGTATVIVKSGGTWVNGGDAPEDKLHLHWRLKAPASGKGNLAKLKGARDLAARIVGGDPSNKPVCHPIRWPGSWHRKAEPRLCEIAHVEPDTEIDLDDALERLKAKAPADSGKDKSSNDANEGAGDGADERSTDELVANIITGCEFHPSLVPLSARLIGSGLFDGSTVTLLRALMNASTAPHDPVRWQVRFNKIPSIVHSAREKFNGAGTNVARVFDPWQRFIVPPFPIEVLPPVAQNFVIDHSAVIGCDPAAVAMSMLATFSGALNHTFALKMLKNGSWYASPRLWVALIGVPSTKKTPAINAATNPLAQYEMRLWKPYLRELAEYKKAKDAGDKAAQEPEPPPRWVASDTTVEALGEILARDGGKGILIKADELSGWLSSMDRYATSGSDRPFWLQAYDGGPHHIDRIKRGSFLIPNLSVSVCGGIQPELLAEIRSDLSTDGLLQRLIPVMLQASTFPDDQPSPDENYNGLVQLLILAKPETLRMSDDALAAMADLRQLLYKLEQASGGLAPGFDAFIGKLAGVCGSLALILHMAHDPQTGTIKKVVGASTVQDVRKLVLDFILPHAFEFYCGTAATSGERLRKLASYILVSGKDRILASDLTTAIRDFRGLTLLEVNERVSPLVAAGWLLPADNTPVCRSWRVNPVVHAQLAERAKTEAERRAKVACLMGRVSGMSGKTT